VIRRDITADATQGSTQTGYLVEDGQVIPPSSSGAYGNSVQRSGRYSGIREGAEAIADFGSKSLICLLTTTVALT